MKFIVTNRKTAEKENLITELHIWISIHDPDKIPTRVEVNEYTQSLLKLDFDDVLPKDVENHSELHLKAMTNHQAKKILNFAKRYIGRITAIVCQCEAGISRSAGIASALSIILNGEEYLQAGTFPNAHVKSLLLRHAEILTD